MSGFRSLIPKRCSRLFCFAKPKVARGFCITFPAYGQDGTNSKEGPASANRSGHSSEGHVGYLNFNRLADLQQNHVCTQNSILSRFLEILYAHGASTTELFNAYRDLPSPGLRYLSEKQAHKLLHRLMIVERKDVASMLRYISVIDDMKLCGYYITLKEWNTALSFVSRCHSTVGNAEVHSALSLWREIERAGTVRADATTFNVLYDMATKSKSPQLPDMILKEMQARQLNMDRFTHVGRIWYMGRFGQGIGVRNAYKDFAENGEVADTVSLNCLMSSLIRAGEPQAAEQILEHMKFKCLTGTTGISPLSKLQKRQQAQLMKDEEFKQSSSAKDGRLAYPDLISFSMFINYHCENTGNFERVCLVLDDMAKFGIRRDRVVYQALFKGFALHGRVRYSPWTAERLEGTFKAFDEDGVAIGKDLAVWCCKAFSEVIGSKMAKAVWSHIRIAWKQQCEEDSDLLSAETLIRSMIEKHVADYNWRQSRGGIY